MPEPTKLIGGKLLTKENGRISVINHKNCSLSIVLTATRQKLKRS